MTGSDGVVDLIDCRLDGPGQRDPRQAGTTATW